MAKLVVVQAAQGPGAEFRLAGQEKAFIGRKSTCQLQIADPKASRQHALVYDKAGKYWLRDLGSRNGTSINDQKIEEDCPLDFGDKIKIGGTVIEFADEMADAPITINVPGYEILARCGSGGMGTVYRARQVSMDRIVALKVLNERYSTDTEFIGRFIREARAAGKLSHPNIIQVHDAGYENGRHFFSMEFVDGETLKAMIKKQGKIPVDQAIDIVSQTAKALQFAHQNNIIHRDIKPDNIMLAKDGNVKIADLGIAKSFDEPTKGDQRIFGTPHYMAPEQALGKPIDHRVDIYSLGATFYHMLTGHTPFSGHTITDVLKAHIHQQLAPIQEFNPEVPDAISFVIERMMAKSPQERYDSAAGVITDLRKIRTGRELDIDRLAPGKSSLMQTLLRGSKRLTASGLKSRLHRVSSRMRKPKTIMKTLGAAALLVFLGLAGYFAAVTLRAQNDPRTIAKALLAAQETELSGDIESAAQEFRKIVQRWPDSEEAKAARSGIDRIGILGESRRLEESDLPEEANRKYQEILGRWPESFEASSAREGLERIKVRLAERTEGEKREETERAYRDADGFAKDHPLDPAAQINKWQEFIAAYPRSAHVQEAQRQIERVKGLMAQKSKEWLDRTLQEVLASANAGLAKKNYDQAIEVLKNFSENGEIKSKGGEEQIAEATQARERIAAQARSESEAALAAAADLEKSERFAKAIAAYQEYCRSVVYKSGTDEAAKRRDALLKRIGDMFDAASKGAEKLVAEFDFAGAADIYAKLKRTVAGTSQDGMIDEMLQTVKDREALHKTVAAAAQKGGKKPLPFAMPKGLPGDWKMVGVTEERIEISSGEASSFLAWKSLSAEQAYLAYMTYLQAPSKEIHKQLAIFCKMRGLDKEAEIHIAASQ